MSRATSRVKTRSGRNGPRSASSFSATSRVAKIVNFSNVASRVGSSHSRSEIVSSSASGLRFAARRFTSRPPSIGSARGRVSSASIARAAISGMFERSRAHAFTSSRVRLK